MKISKKRKEMGEEKWAEYQKERKNKKAKNWKVKNADKVVNWRRRAKIKLIHYLGGKCKICGYNEQIASAYDFHHRDPKEKEFGLSGKTISFERLKKEADKCNLLCCRCHMEIHEEDYKAQREYTIKEWKNLANKI